MLEKEHPLTLLKECPFMLTNFLISGMHQPDVQTEHAEVNYSIPGSSTGLQIRSFKVKNSQSQPERWVKYEIQYCYKVQMFPDLSID